MLLKETIAYYINNDSLFYCIMLDAIKAFDRISYCKLFREVMKRGLPVACVCLMLSMYTNRITGVAWNGVYSKSFKILNCVKQGAIVSPILFCIYLNGLLCKLRESGDGCFVGVIFVGALAYADDLSLLLPAPSVIHQLLTICERYADEFDIVFKGAKSKCIFTVPTKYRASTYGPNLQLTISGKNIEYVDHWPHLGHIVTNCNDDEADITFRCNKLCGQISIELCFLNERCPIVKAKLLTSYIMVRCCGIYRIRA
jgi:Reverse transcriptase (RNA-dependent DNA polymerase)